MGFINWQSLRMNREGRIPMAKWNALVDALRSATLTSVLGGRLQRTPIGSTLTIDGGGGGVSAGADHPWKPYVVDGLDIRLIPGAVGGMVPSDIGSDLTLTASATGRGVYLEIGVDQQGNVESLTIEEGASFPTAAEPGSDGTLPTTIYHPLFSYDSGSSGVTRIYQITRYNLRVKVEVTDGGCADIYRSINVIEAVAEL